MKTLLRTTIVAAIAAAFAATLAMCAVSAFAASTPQPQPDARVHSPNASALPQPQPEAQGTIATPTPIGLCKTDRTRKLQCTAAWDRCVSVRYGGPVCQRDWRRCCNRSMSLEEDRTGEEDKSGHRK